MKWQDVQSWADVDNLRLTREENAAFEAELLRGGPVADRLCNREAIEADIGRRSVERGVELIWPLLPHVCDWVDGFSEEYGPLSDEAREALVTRIIGAYEKGFIMAAGESADAMRAGARSGAIATSQKAEARRCNIIAAYDATEPSLSEAERYAAVKIATGVKSDETIRKALRSR